MPSLPQAPAALTVQIDLAPAVGDDADSEWAMAKLLSHGVNVLPIRRPGKNSLPRAMVIIEANGGRTFIHETFVLSEIDLTANLEVVQGPVRSCLYIEGFHYKRIMPSIARFHEVGWNVSLHTAGLPESSRNPQAFERLIGQVDLTFINDDTLREIFSIGTPLASMIEEACRAIVRVKPPATWCLRLANLARSSFARVTARRSKFRRCPSVRPTGGLFSS